MLKRPLNPKNNPCGTLCYTFSPCDADRERHHGRTLCVGVCPVNAFSSACMMHLLTAIRGGHTGDYEQNWAWKQAPSQRQHYYIWLEILLGDHINHTVYIWNGHTISFTLLWLSPTSGENTGILWWCWWWWWCHKKVWHQHLDGPQSLIPMDQREKLFLRS